jgi:hypothetical protein
MYAQYQPANCFKLLKKKRNKKEKNCLKLAQASVAWKEIFSNEITFLVTQTQYLLNSCASITIIIAYTQNLNCTQYIYKVCRELFGYFYSI